MATQTINQANLNAQNRLLNEQSARESQVRGQNFAASESQKARNQQTKLYNLKAGDTFATANPVQIFSDDQKNKFSDAVGVTYSKAQDEILKARDMMSSGKTKDRIEGQMAMTRANNRLKQLAEDSMLFDQELEEAANNANIPNQNSADIKDIYRASIEGSLELIENIETSEEENKTGAKGRFIKWQGVDGEDRYMSLAEYEKVKNGLIGRVDVNEWIKSTAENLATTEIGTVTKLRSPEALDSHVNSHLSDPEVVKAYEHQFGVQGAEAVGNQLKDMLRAEKGVTLDEPVKPTAVRQLSYTDLSKIEDREQRKFDNVQSLDKDPLKAAAFITNKIEGSATRSGPKEWVGKEMLKAEIVNGKIVITMKEGGNPRVIPWDKNINELYNEIRYASGAEGKISESGGFSDTITATDHGAQFRPDKSEVKGDSTRRESETSIDSFINNEGLVSGKNVKALVKALKFDNPNTFIAGIKGEDTNIFGGNGIITFKGDEYEVSNKKEDIERLRVAIDDHIRTGRGQEKRKGSETKIKSR